MLDSGHVYIFQLSSHQSRCTTAIIVVKEFKVVRHDGQGVKCGACTGVMVRFPLLGLLQKAEIERI